VVTFTIITTAANEAAPSPRPDGGAAQAGGLGLATRPALPGHGRAHPLLVPSPTGSLVARPVSPRVNDAVTTVRPSSPPELLRLSRPRFLGTYGSAIGWGSAQGPFRSELGR